MADAINENPKKLPKTSGWPLVGTLPQLIRDPFRFIMEARETYGDIYTLDLGITKVVVLNNPRHGRYILRDNAANYYKGGGLWEASRKLVGNGLIVSEGDLWLRQRRLMQPQFHRRHIAKLSTLMVESIDGVYRTWEDLDTAVSFNITNGFNHVTMSVILHALFGTALTEAEMNEAGEEITVCLDYLIQGTLTYRFPNWVPVPGKAKFEKARASFDQKVYRVIEQCRQGKGQENHLLAMLLNLVDSETGEGMTTEELRNEVATLFIAGYETTSIALSWTVHYLLKHPDVLRKLQAEVDAVLGDRLPTMDDIAALPYTKMVFQETLRIRPPSYWVPRTATEEDVIDGYTIPAGSNVVSLTYAYHHHPEFWEEAERFDPERFAPEQGGEKHMSAWLPFGLGQRLCIGRDFVMIEGQLALAMLIQRFDFEAKAEQATVPQLATTLRPKNGIEVYLKKRT
ncbi:MAG: cytochrome P450 [Chloroflexota bacterium]